MCLGVGLVVHWLACGVTSLSRGKLGHLGRLSWPTQETILSTRALMLCIECLLFSTLSLRVILWLSGIYTSSPRISAIAWSLTTARVATVCLPPTYHHHSVSGSTPYYSSSLWVCRASTTGSNWCPPCLLGLAPH